MPVTQILISDDRSATPRPDELLLWVGDGPPIAGPRLLHAGSPDEAIALLAQRPAEIRLALRRPLAFLTSLAA